LRRKILAAISFLRPRRDFIVIKKGSCTEQSSASQPFRTFTTEIQFHCDRGAEHQISYSTIISKTCFKHFFNRLSPFQSSLFCILEDTSSSRHNGRASHSRFQLSRIQSSYRDNGYVEQLHLNLRKSFLRTISGRRNYLYEKIARRIGAGKCSLQFRSTSIMQVSISA
jgi:hypothetical protein